MRAFSFVSISNIEVSWPRHDVYSVSPWHGVKFEHCITSNNLPTTRRRIKDPVLKKSVVFTCFY